MLKDYIVEVRSLENMSRLELQQIIRKIIKKVTIYEDGHYDGFSVFYTENGGATVKQVQTCKNINQPAGHTGQRAFPLQYN